MIVNTWKTKFTIAMGAVLLASSVTAASFPSRDIRLIVPWPAGGGADAISRKVSNIAEHEFSKSIYVENIGGAITATGLMQMAKSRPDGHTIGVLTYDSIITIPHGDMIPGYSLDKMKPIARLTTEADAFVVSKKSGFTSFEEVIAAAKANPNTIRVGVAPKGSGPYLAVHRLEKMIGIDFNVISYPGSSSAESEALLSGELDAAISSLGDFGGIIGSGDAKGLVELTTAQNPSFPTVPPISDLGYEIETGSFILLAAPKRTPDDVIESLEAAYKKAFESDEFQQWIAKVGVTPNWLGSEDAAQWIVDLQKKTFAVMDDLNL